MFCKNCGHEVNEGRFCPNCGKEFINDINQQVNGQGYSGNNVNTYQNTNMNTYIHTYRSYPYQRTLESPDSLYPYILPKKNEGSSTPRNCFLKVFRNQALL